MNILVIGNGFDIAHNLPTKYSDFLDFIREFNSPCNNAEDCGTKCRFTTDILRIRESLPQISTEIETLTLDNLWINYFLQMQETLIASGKEGWIDFEAEISRIIRTFDEVRSQLNEQIRVGKTGVELNHTQQEVLDPIIIPNKLHLSSKTSITPPAISHFKKTLYKDLNRLTRCLEIYLCHVVSQMSCDKLSVVEKLKIDRVLTFNYTNTFERIYGYDTKDIQYDYIHGKVCEDSTVESCNLVLGIDEYQERPYCDNDNEYIQFKKFYQRIYKMTGCKYIDWLIARSSAIQRTPKLKDTYKLNLYFYGHSLDVTDKDILRKLVLEDGANTVIFYHSQNSLGNQIANLVKVIGEDELIKRTDGSNRSITFVDLKSQDISIDDGYCIEDML